MLLAAVKAGVGREEAHAAIKEHAVAVALALRDKGADANDLVERLAVDGRLRLGRAQIEALMSEPLEFTGDARRQTAAFVARVGEIAARHPHAAAYTPEPIL